jgi:1-deoxy-D-xylulose-5-phosphate reductoisomerase
MRGVAVLGSTGSIGTSALKVLARQRDRFRVVALTAYGQRERLEAQVAAFRPAFVGLVNGTTADGWRAGRACLVEAVTRPDVDIVLNGIVGAAGLEATLAALAAGKRVALANKETLVMAGELVMRTAREQGGEIVPVDSEHSAVLQCVTGRPAAEFHRLILTASGGPFHSWEADRVRHATVDEALNHPTWRMGRKISVDSATLANKALEVIEAHFLFGLPYDRIEAVVHPQSVIHSFVEFVDGSVLAQLGFPNMELPILYALTHPDRVPDDGVTRFDPVAAGSLTFEPVRTEVFPALALGFQAGRTGGSAPAAFNAANEVAVAAFLAGRAPFGRIAEVVGRVLEEQIVTEVESVAQVLEADAWARGRTEELLGCS